MTQGIREFYDSDPQKEWARLETPAFRVEYLATQRLIDRHLPTKGHAVDVGGGPGRYTVDLINRGLDVTLVDLSQKNVEMARTKLHERGLVAKQLLCADARDLSALPSASFDAGLLLGPLYHLPNREERGKALAEFFRILKPGAVGIAGYLNGWGLIRTGLSDFSKHLAKLEFLPTFLSDGKIDIWHWVTPPRARTEVRAAGFEMVTYIGADGAFGGVHRSLERFATEHPQGFDDLVRFAVSTLELPQFRDTADHLQLVVRKP